MSKQKAWPIDKKLAKDRQVLDEKEKRHAAMKLWRLRLENIERHNDISVAAFCRRHGFTDTLVFHQMAGTKSAREDYFKRFEAALRKEESKYISSKKHAQACSTTLGNIGCE